jgi:hypothetical protein
MCSEWDPEFTTGDVPQWVEERPVLLGEFQTQVPQRPVDNSNQWAWKHWLALCLDFPNPYELRSNMFCCCPCLRFPQDTLNWENFHTKQGHVPTASSIDWLGCHVNRPGRSSLWTLPVPGEFCPLWHHNQVFSDWSDCVSTPAMAPSTPHTSNIGASNKQEHLIWRWLISSGFPPHLFKVQLRWHSSHVSSNYQSGSCILQDRKCF